MASLHPTCTSSGASRICRSCHPTWRLPRTETRALFPVASLCNNCTYFMYSFMHSDRFPSASQGKLPICHVVSTTGIPQPKCHYVRIPIILDFHYSCLEALQMLFSHAIETRERLLKHTSIGISQLERRRKLRRNDGQTPPQLSNILPASHLFPRLGHPLPHPPPPRQPRWASGTRSRAFARRVASGMPWEMMGPHKPSGHGGLI